MECRVKVDIFEAESFIEEPVKSEYEKRALDAFDTLMGKSGPGNDFLGWLDLPFNIDKTESRRYEEIAEEWRVEGVEFIVVVGIGGSYIGARAVYDALSPYFYYTEVNRGYPKLIFAGQNMSGEYLAELREILKNKKFAIIYVSKSGTTIETSLAFRMLKRLSEEIYGKEGSIERIKIVTSEPDHPFRDFADIEGYEAFSIPDNVGGRFSVLSAAGLLPITVSGFNTAKLLEGAEHMRSACHKRSESNPAITYACIRNMLYDKGYGLEILATYNPRLKYTGEWWKQLFGESEGKDGKGIFPVSLTYTADMHGLGQYIQEGRRLMFETVLSVESSGRDIRIVSDPSNPDGFEFLAGRNIDECSSIAEIGIKNAHVAGGVPNIRISIPTVDEFSMGALIYFFEFSCAISGYMLGVNPFDQPGVELYKKNMFKLLGKPGL